MPEPILVSWLGQSVRVKHDDPHLGPFTPSGAVIRNAVHLATDARGIKLALDATVGDRYAVSVLDRGAGVTIGLRLLPQSRS